MLLGRAVEVGRINRLLRAAARERVSAALVVHGEAGIGKTSLLDQIAAEADGEFAVLRARPLEAEADLPFAGLFDLVRPAHHLLDRIPAPQAAALRGSLALGPPAPGDRFTVAAATLSLLATVADEAPVLVIVDDAHWLDSSSREALLFAARRLANEGVVLLLGTREPSVAQIGIEALELGGLDGDEAAALLDSRGVRVDGRVRDWLIAQTRGNPLALLEAISRLTEAQLAGTTPIPEPLPVGDALERSFAHYLDGLPQATGDALLIAAASGTGDTREVVRALRLRELDRVTLEPAEAIGLIEVGERVEFRHPLLRSAAYHAQGPAQQRAAHRALAAASRGTDRGVWHLAAATAGPDETVAAELEAVGEAAMQRSAYAAAASALEASADRSLDDAPRLRRSLAAGRALWLAGETQRAALLLDSVLDLATEPTIRADLQNLRLGALLFARPVPTSIALLATEAARVQPYDAQRAAVLYAHASLASVLCGDVEGLDRFARLAAAADGSDSSAGTAARMLRFTAAASLGEVAEANALLEPLLERVQAVHPLDPLFPMVAAMVFALIIVERWALADEVLVPSLERARAVGAPSVLVLPLVMRAELELRRGRILEAYASATEADQLAAETGQTVARLHSLTLLARAEAILGHEVQCRAHAAAAQELARVTEAIGFEWFSAAALTLLDLSHGLAGRVAADTTPLEQMVKAGLPNVAQIAGDRIEACVRAGVTERAAPSLALLEAQAERTGLQFPLTIAARSRGLLAENGFDAEFEEALELCGSDMPFERARTLLCLGMRQSRSRRRSDARASLRAALEYFEAAGAEPLAKQTRDELHAAGESLVIRGSGSLRPLTPRELQVALLVAGGASNREVAATLFLTEKTIEFHLRHVYEKLGVRGRTELVRRVEGLPLVGR